HGEEVDELLLPALGDDLVSRVRAPSTDATSGDQRPPLKRARIRELTAQTVADLRKRLGLPAPDTGPVDAKFQEFNEGVLQGSGVYGVDPDDEEIFTDFVAAAREELGGGDRHAPGMILQRLPKLTVRDIKRLAVRATGWMIGAYVRGALD